MALVKFTADKLEEKKKRGKRPKGKVPKSSVEVIPKAAAQLNGQGNQSLISKASRKETNLNLLQKAQRI